jgi:hypothetical protein
MSPTSPRVPTQSAITPTLVPSPSVSRVTGQVENIPDIRRSSDPNYVVMDEQVVPALPPPNIPPASAPPTTPEVASAVPATPVPQTAAPPQSNPAASVPVTNPQFTDKIEFTGSQMIRGKNYRIQVGSFTDLKNASEVFLRLFDADLNPSYESYEHYGDKYYRVVITNVKAEDADALSRKLAEIGITEALAREDAVRE